MISKAKVGNERKITQKVMINKKISKYMKNKRSAGETLHSLKDGKSSLLLEEVEIDKKKCLEKVMKDSCKKQTNFPGEEEEMLRVITPEELIKKLEHLAVDKTL